jgi:hypothetical protein
MIIDQIKIIFDLLTHLKYAQLQSRTFVLFFCKQTFRKQNNHKKYNITLSEPNENRT